MKNETLRIMRLVEQGKLSAEDALELLEALGNQSGESEVEAPAAPAGSAAPAEPAEPAEQPTAPPQAEATTSTDGEPKAASNDPFSRFFQSIDEMTKNVATGVNWKEVADKVNQGVNKGVEAVQKAAEDAKKSGTFAGVFGAEASKDVSLPLSVPSGKVLRIEGQKGQIHVVGSDELGTMDLRATYRGSNTAEAQAKADQFVPMLQENDHVVVLKLPDGPDVSVTVNAKVAKGTPVEVKLARGDVHVEGVGSNARIETLSGQVKLSDAKGVVDTTVASGDIAMTNVHASLLTVQTTSGDVSLQDCSGAINVNAGSGNTDLVRVSGRTIAVETTSGDVNLDICEPVRGSVTVRTVSGDVGVEIMDGSECRVTLSTLRGAVASDIPLDDKTADGQSLSGRLGAGTGTITATAVSGDVRLGLRDSTAPDA